MANFKKGDKVLFHGKPAIIKEIINEPDADYILDNGFYAEDEELTAANSCRSRNAVVANALNASRKVARNAGAYDVAGEAGKLFKDAYNDLAGCAAKLERLTTLGQPDDVPGNDNKIAAWAKDKARKVRDIMNKIDQGRL